MKNIALASLVIVLCLGIFAGCSKEMNTANTTDISNPIRGRWQGYFNLNEGGQVIERLWDFTFTEDFKYHVICSATIEDVEDPEHSFTESGIYVFQGSSGEGKDIKLVKNDNQTIRYGSYTMGRRDLYLTILGWGQMNLRKYEG